GIIRRGNLAGLVEVPLASYRVFIYGFSAIAIPALVVGMAFGRRLRLSAGVLAGLCFAAAVCCLAIGLAILPLSILGLFIVIGVLGFVPFVTALVYLRNGVRLWQQAREKVATRSLAAITAVVFVIALGGPVVVRWQANRTALSALDQLRTGNPAAADAAVERLHSLRWFSDPEGILYAYEVELDPARKEKLGRVYHDITGEDAEVRL